jgi:hypothetical protein
MSMPANRRIMVVHFYQVQCVFFVCGHGGLDLLYLSSRYEKGKRAVAELMEERHSGVSYRQLNLAHGEIVSKQAALGRSTFPG